MPKSKFVYDAEDVAGLIIIPAEGYPPPVEPRGLADKSILAHRQIIRSSEHMRPLNDMVARLRAEDRGSVPDFDPMDGGVNARLLFLLEKPGPMTDADRPGRRGSGFISRDNDDQSAEALFTFMNEARIPREETLLWNVIPWWNGTIRLTPDERREGLSRLEELLDLLPRLEGVVLVGQKAARARPILKKRRLPVWVSAHPSPRVRARYPDRFRQIPYIWADAVKCLQLT